MFDFTYDGPGPGKGGTGVLSVDGKEVDRKTIEHTIPLLMAIDETFDVGADTRTALDDLEYQLPFRFTGAINKLTYKLGPEQMSAEDKKAAGEACKSQRTPAGSAIVGDGNCNSTACLQMTREQRNWLR